MPRFDTSHKMTGTALRRVPHSLLWVTLSRGGVVSHRKSPNPVTGRWGTGLVAVMAVLLVWPSTNLRAADPGEAVFTFLKLGADARAEGMGGAAVALAEGVSALYYNPAGIAESRPGELQLTYHNWVADIQSGFVGAVTRLGEDTRVGGSIQYVDYGEFLPADVNGNPRADFSASNFALGLSVARVVAERTSVGLTGRFITEAIDGESQTGVAVDAGLIHRLADERTQVGVAVRNAGSQMTTFGDAPKENLPLTLVAGFSHKMRGAPLLLAADAMKPYDDDFGVAFGAEAMVARSLAIRAGYNTLNGRIDTGSDSDKTAGFRIGAGFTTARLSIDYGLGLMSELGSSHRVTLKTHL
ncbi:MAG: PorV/PorQ family protein [Candidatus Zixiibacteriota bacterium]